MPDLDHIEAGELDKRLTIELPGTTLGSRGQAAKSPATFVAKVWGSIETLSGSELEAASKVFAAATVRIKMRYRRGITTRHQITYAGRTFHIGHINNWRERNVYLVLTCSEER